MEQSALKKVKALFLDMDGVLWADKKEIGRVNPGNRIDCAFWKQQCDQNTGRIL